MSIAPIVHTIRVKVPPARAFDLFATRMGRWWQAGRTPARNPHADIVVEPRPGGGWFEVDAEGAQTRWGSVLVWDPPGKLVLGWQLNSQFTYDPSLVTEVELTFTADGDGTLVRLEHRDLERFGTDAEEMRRRISGGWPDAIERYVTYANMDDFVVYTVPGSPYGRAVLAALEEKGAPYRLAALKPGGQREPEHLARHAFGKIPAIEHGDFSLYETQAILRYIDALYPSPRLTPTGLRAAARMAQLMNINDCYLFQGVSNVIVFNRVVRPRVLGLPPDEEAVAAAMPRAHTVFAELARLLAGQPFFTGDALTLADILIAAHMDLFRLTPEWEVLASPHPALPAWLDRMNARPSMAATTWERLAARAQAA